MFTAALFTITKTWKQPTCPSTDEWTRRYSIYIQWNITQSSVSSVQSLSHVQLFATPWTVAHQAPLSMEFSRPEYWSGFPVHSPGDLPDPGTEPQSPALQADFYHLSHQGSPFEVGRIVPIHSPPKHIPGMRHMEDGARHTSLLSLWRPS